MVDLVQQALDQSEGAAREELGGEENGMSFERRPKASPLFFNVHLQERHVYMYGLILQQSTAM